MCVRATQNDIGGARVSVGAGGRRDVGATGRSAVSVCAHARASVGICFVFFVHGHLFGTTVCAGVCEGVGERERECARENVRECDAGKSGWKSARRAALAASKEQFVVC